MAVVVLQKGHCFRTSGATGTQSADGSLTEQQFTNAAVNRAVSALSHAGHRGRAILADEPSSSYGGDFFVSVHCDGSVHASARGASVGYRTNQGARFAATWKTAYADAGWTGGFRADNYTSALAGYYGTRHAVNRGTTYAFVAECGFLTSPADLELLSLSEGADRFARAITTAVVELAGGTNLLPLRPISQVEPTRGGRPVLRLGSTGATVRDWQRILLGAGHDLGSAGADGVFGPMTEQATKQFQAQLGVAVDGIVGPQTHEATARLLALLRRTQGDRTGSQVPAFPGRMHRGSIGVPVKTLQRRLAERGWRITIDGIFGPQTEKTVRAFQSEKGLGVDGIVGPITWDALWAAPIT